MGGPRKPRRGIRPQTSNKGNKASSKFGSNKFYNSEALQNARKKSRKGKK